MGAAPVSAAPPSQASMRSQVWSGSTMPLPGSPDSFPAPIEERDSKHDDIYYAELIYRQFVGSKEGFEPWLAQFDKGTPVDRRDFEKSFITTPLGKKVEITSGAWRYLFGDQGRSGLPTPWSKKADQIQGRDEMLKMLGFVGRFCEQQASVQVGGQWGVHDDLSAAGLAFQPNPQLNAMREQATGKVAAELFRYEGAWEVVSTDVQVGALLGGSSSFYLDSVALARYEKDSSPPKNLYQNPDLFYEDIRQAYNFIADWGGNPKSVDPGMEQQAFAHLALVALRARFDRAKTERDNGKTDFDRVLKEVGETEEKYRVLERDLSQAASPRERERAQKALESFEASDQMVQLQRFGAEFRRYVRTGQFDLHYVRTGEFPDTLAFPDKLEEQVAAGEPNKESPKQEEVHAHE